MADAAQNVLVKIVDRLLGVYQPHRDDETACVEIIQRAIDSENASLRAEVERLRSIITASRIMIECNQAFREEDIERLKRAGDGEWLAK